MSVRGASHMIAHTIPFLLRNQGDLEMADRCFSSLQNTKDSIVVLFNQGYMTNEELVDFLVQYKIEFHILGKGVNVGIPAARAACMEYIWSKMPECDFISEIHVDMIFPTNWCKPLIKFLDRSEEPMVCPGIVTQFGEVHPLAKNIQSVQVPDSTSAIIELCDRLKEDKICQGFVHPVVHKSQVLKEIGGYDTGFLTGKQGYEDDSLLLGYSYYLGTKRAWKPKCYLESYVYHASLAQRATLENIHAEFAANKEGLFRQYGAYGFKQLARIHNNAEFLRLFDQFRH